MRKMIPLILLISILFSVATAQTSPYYEAYDGISDYRTWSYDDWKSSYPDLNIDEDTLNIIGELTHRVDIKTVKAEYSDGDVVIKIETVGNAISNGELTDLLNRNIVFAIGGK